MPFAKLFILTALTALLAGCAVPGGPGANPTPGANATPLAWDHDPGRLIVEARDCCGLVPPVYAGNYIPARIWGDGRVVWTEFNGQSRRVLEARLTEDQLRALLQRIVDAGFFSWQSRYTSDPPIMDAPGRTLQVNLTGTPVSVSVMDAGPNGFDDLFAFLRSGAGQTGAAIATPQRAYLTALPVPADTSATVVQWPAAEAGFTLAEAENGKAASGKAVAVAWQALNADLGTLFESEGQYYQIILNVSQLTEAAPPIP